MAEQLERIDRRIIFSSLFVIVVFAIMMHLSDEKTLSLMSLLVISLIALDNIGYIYGRDKRVK